MVQFAGKFYISLNFMWMCVLYVYIGWLSGKEGKKKHTHSFCEEMKMYVRDNGAVTLDWVGLVFFTVNTRRNGV